MASEPGLVIFDCDGVLVDSERLNVQTWLGMMGDLGIDMSTREVVQTFVGKAYADNRVTIQEMTGAVPDPEWERRWRAEFRRSHERLEVIPGARAAVEAVQEQGWRVCLASGSVLAALELKLTTTGLADLFPVQTRFSAEQVEHGKPAPDVFLAAAATMGYEPGRCVVVEDSKAGVEAAVAAGMPVIGLASEMTPGDWFDQADAVIHAMSELPSTLSSL